MKKLHLKKNKIASIALITSALLLSTVTNAQIVYTDVNPDSVINNQSYNLDLNNDGIADFKITDSTWLVSTLCGLATAYVNRITPLHNNAVLSDATAYPYALQANDAIAPDLSSWLATPNQILVQVDWYCSRGDGLKHPRIKGNYWFNISDSKYAGLKLTKGSNTYYGWVRLTSGSSFTVKDYAFNSTPNMPILAGQKADFNWVAISNVTPLKNLYCPGDSLKIQYAALGTFNANIFKVQLSDSTGSFKNSVTIGSIKSNGTAGFINAKIPVKTSPGAQYSIRVVSSNPSADSLYGIKTGITIGAGIAVEEYGSTTFCAGYSTVLMAPSGYTYQWLKNGKKIKGETGYALSVVASGNYSCIVKACGNDTSNTITITVNPLPKAVIVASGPTTFCNGGSVTLSDTVDGSGATYSWYGTNGGDPIPGATKSYYTATSTADYSVVVTTKKECSATSSVLIIAAISPQGDIGRVGDLSFCVGDSTLLVADNNNHVDNSFQYQWKKNGQNIAGATNETYSVKIAGIYTCTMTNVCGSVTPPGITLTTKQCLISNSVTNNEKIISPITQLKIAPNPFSNSTTISFTLPQSQKAMPSGRQVSISIYDITGRLIKTLTNAQMQAGSHQLTWNEKNDKGNAVSAGIYFLRMQTGNYTETKKLSVVR